MIHVDTTLGLLADGSHKLGKMKKKSMKYQQHYFSHSIPDEWA